MNMLFIPQVVAHAADSTAANANTPGSSWSMWIMLLLVFVVMWFFMIRPQRKQQKELEAFQNSLRKGDKVVIGNSGIFGEIIEVNDKSALVRVDGDTKLRVAKQVLVKDTTDIQQ